MNKEEIRKSLEDKMMVRLPDYDWQLISDKLDQARAEEREKLRESVIKIHDEASEEWSEAEYRSNYMSTLLTSLQDNK